MVRLKTIALLICLATGTQGFASSGSAAALAQMTTAGRVVSVPEGIRCADLACVHAFVDAFGTSEEAGWRLYFLQAGRSRASARSPEFARIAEVLGRGLYVKQFAIKEGLELNLRELHTDDGCRYYMIENILSPAHSWYLVPTGTRPPVD
jgi:hypothetical protein